MFLVTKLSARLKILFFWIVVLNILLAHTSNSNSIKKDKVNIRKIDIKLMFKLRENYEEKTVMSNFIKEVIKA